MQTKHSGLIAAVFFLCLAAGAAIFSTTRLSQPISPTAFIPSSQTQLAQVASTCSTVCSGLVGYWSLDDGSGLTAADTSGTGNNGALSPSSNPPTWTTGTVGSGALTFSGSGQNVTIPASTNYDFSGDFTVAAWVRGNSSTGNFTDPLARSTANESSFWSFTAVPSTPGIWFEYYNGSQFNSICSNIAYNNQWYFVVGTLHGTTIQCYVNGVAGSPSTITGSTINLTGSPVTIGSQTGSFSGAFNGSVDDVRLYDRALSTSDIQSLYALGTAAGGSGGGGSTPTQPVTPPVTQPSNPPVTCAATATTPGSYYVTSSGTGCKNGSDWNNAFAGVPSTLIRGSTYYIASGSYGSYLFNTPESGTSVITILKATSANAGSVAGWQSSYGTGQAVFGNSPYTQTSPFSLTFSGIDFATSYWTFDGAVSNGLTPSGYGFTFSPNTSTTGGENYLGISAFETYTFNGMVIKNTAITCSTLTGNPEQGIVSGTQANVVSPLIEYDYVSGCNNALFMAGSAWTIEHSDFLNGWSTGNNHGVMIDQFSVNNTTFAYNYVQGCIYICIEANGSVNAATLVGWKIYGNVFKPDFTTPVGIVSGASTQVVSSVTIDNNTIINSDGPLLSEQDPSPGSIMGSGNTAVDNLFYNQTGSSGVFVTNGGAAINYGYNSWWGSSNTQTSGTDQTVASGNPFVSLSGQNYQLAQATASGLSLASPYNMDPTGTTRGTGGVWSIGAYQYTGTVTQPPPSSGIQTFYIDYVSGHDSNSGTSELSPWQHAPGMQGCTATCGATIPIAGDQFVFKGGVTWPNAVFQWNWSWSGTSAAPIHIGVGDKSWYTGSAWTRPIFNAGGTVMSGENDFIYMSAGLSYITIDNIEFTGMYWTGNPSYGNAVMINDNTSAYISVTNDYFHSWTHDTVAHGTFDKMEAVEGGGAGDSIDHSLFDGSPSGTDSGSMDYEISQVTDSVARNMSNGILGAGVDYGNTIGPINTSFDTTDHENCIEPMGQAVNYIYNNVFFDCTAVVLLTPGNSTPSSNYIFNNVFYGSGPIAIELDSPTPASSNSVYIYNNTIDAGSSASCTRVVNRGNGPVGTVDMRNNFCISGVGFIDPYDSNPGAGTTINTSNITLTPAAATAANLGTSETYVFAPLDPTCNGQANCPVGAGTNLTSLATGTLAPLMNDTAYGCSVSASNQVVCPARTTVSRPSIGAWDVGAYQYSSGTVTSPPIGTPPTISTLSSTGITSTSATIIWTTAPAASDQVIYGLTSLYGNATAIDSALGTSHSVTLTGLTPDTIYHYEASSTASGLSGVSSDQTFTTLPAPDTTPPTVSITSPSGTISGSVTIAASATDSGSGVNTVQFKLDGTNMSGGLFTTPTSGSTYSGTWNTAGVSNGTHILTAVATDVAGNSATSANVSVTINNVVVDATPPVVTAFSIPSTAISLTIPITTFTATDNVGVTGYAITTTATQPSAWTTSVPTSIALSVPGTITLYAWARDAAGNISTAKTASIVITLPATTSPPVILPPPVISTPPITPITPVTSSPSASAPIVTVITTQAPSGGGGGGGGAPTSGGGATGMITPSVTQKPAIVTTLPVTAGVSASIPATLLSIPFGTRSSSVVTLQNDLISLGDLAYGYNTGYYGALTQAAVAKYQASQIVTTTAFTTFTRTLAVGSTGADVKALQVFLNNHGFLVALTGPGSKGNETTYFGSATKAALVRFQAAHGIPATGFFGPITMGVINKLI